MLNPCLYLEGREARHSGRPIFPAIGRQRQEDLREFVINAGSARADLKNKTNRRKITNSTSSRTWEGRRG